MRFNFLLCLLLLFLVSGASAQSGSVNLKKNANAIIQSESNQINFKSFDKYEQRYSRRVKVLNKKAERLQSVSIHYKKGSDELDDIKISVYGADGSLIKKVKSKELEDFAASDGFSMITDYRVKHWKHNSNNYPVTIEYSYTKESSTTLSLPRWNPIPTYNVAVEESTYELIGDLPVRTKSLNIEDFESISLSEHNYKMVNQAALNKEKYSASTFDIFPAIIINPIKFSFEGISGSFDTWQGYGAWIYNSFLNEKALDKPEEVKAELDKIINAGDSEIEIAKKIYDYVQANTRYVSIALDEGGLNPMHPSKVHDVKYGDCKALSFYMHSLLKLYGVNSNYVEVHADAEFPISLYEDFPSSFPGNHIILQLPMGEDTAWVDCTSSKNPFDYLGEFTDDRTVLCISKEGGVLTKTPKLDKTKNANTEVVKMHIDEDGNAKAEFNQQSIGYTISRNLRLADMKDDDKVDYVKEKIYDNLSISNCSEILVATDEESPQSEMKFELEIKDYAETAGKYVFIPNKLGQLNIPKLPKDGRRESDIYFPRAYTQISTVTITIDGAYNILEMKPISIEDEYGKYSKVVEKVGDELVIKRSFELNKNIYSKSDYKVIKSFFDKCIKSDREPTTIEKS